MHRIVLIGPQGSGKGTQGELLAAHFSIPTISLGSLYRAHIKAQSETGKKIKSYVESGALVPDDIGKEVMRERVAQDDAKPGFILDGYPRNAKQCADLEEFATIDAVLVIGISDEEAVKRISGRRQCSQGHIYHVTFNPPQQEGVCDHDGEQLYQRDDDTKEAVQKRLAIYHAETEPIIQHYRDQGIVHDIDGAQSVQDVQQSIVDVLR